MDYSQEPPHSGLLIVKGTEPFNAEPDISALVEFKYTPEDLIYCRNHGPVREIPEENYTININGNLPTEIRFTIQELRATFPRAEVVAALQVIANLFSPYNSRQL